MDPNQPTQIPPAQPPSPANPQVASTPPSQPESAPPPTATPPAPGTPTPPSAASRKPIPRKLLLIIGGGVLLLLLIILGIFLGGSSGKNAGQTKDPTTTATPTEALEDIKNNSKPSPAAKKASHLLVYGVWTGQTSAIKAVDVTTSHNFILATLPLQIKKVNILSDKTLLYIDQTDTQDHGKRISIYNIKDQTIHVSIPAAAGFFIDDYVLSPNKQYIAVWEKSFAPGLRILQGGQSRVYAIDLSRPTIKNLLYDELIDNATPVHYPRAILNNGTVFNDTFMADDPKGGGGWAYGMSVVDFDGENKKDLEFMKEGTYGTQPTLSPDGKYLLFAGYDGTQGNKKAANGGTRQALLTPNTVGLLNTQTLARFQLPNLTNTNTYSAVHWDHQTENVIIAVLSKDEKQSGLYTYNLGARHADKLSLPLTDSGPSWFISELPGGKSIIGTRGNDTSNVGNLGENYAQAFNQLATLDAKGTITYLSIQDPYIQYITVLPGNYYKSFPGANN